MYSSEIKQLEAENSGRRRDGKYDTAAHSEAGHENSKPREINPSKPVDEVYVTERTRGADQPSGAAGAGPSTPRTQTFVVREWLITPDRDGAIMKTRVISSARQKIKNQSQIHRSARAHIHSSSAEIIMSSDPDLGVEIGLDLTKLAKSPPASWNTDEADGKQHNFGHDRSAVGTRGRGFQEIYKPHPTLPAPAGLSFDLVDEQTKLKAWEYVPKLPVNTPRRAMVSHVVTPHHFYVVLKEDLLKRHDMNGNLFRKVSFGMPRFDRSRDTVPLVVVRHENIWKRGRLLHFDHPIKYDEANTICEVFLIDYGQTILVEENDLKKPGKEIMEIEPMAYRCSMANIKPGQLTLSTEYLDGQNWHPSVAARLKLFGTSSKESFEKGVEDIFVECHGVKRNISYVDIQITGTQGTWGERLVKVGLAERQNDRADD